MNSQDDQTSRPSETTTAGKALPPPSDLSDSQSTRKAEGAEASETDWASFHETITAIEDSYSRHRQVAGGPRRVRTRPSPPLRQSARGPRTIQQSPVLDKTSEPERGTTITVYSLDAFSRVEDVLNRQERRYLDALGASEQSPMSALTTPDSPVMREADEAVAGDIDILGELWAGFVQDMIDEESSRMSQAPDSRLFSAIAVIDPDKRIEEIE